MTDSQHPMPPFFPIAYEVEEGKIYHWCGCGKSKTQPLCDRENCGDCSVAYHAANTETVYFCGCKETRDPPLCDGSHARLLREYLKKVK
jgi:CDGSH-type Zn-finger protein